MIKTAKQGVHRIISNSLDLASAEIVNAQNTFEKNLFHTEEILTGDQFDSIEGRFEKAKVLLRELKNELNNIYREE